MLKHSTGFIRESEWSHKRDTCNPDGMESVTVLYNKNLLNALHRYSHCHFACKNALSTPCLKKQAKLFLL